MTMQSWNYLQGMVLNGRTDNGVLLDEYADAYGDTFAELDDVVVSLVAAGWRRVVITDEFGGIVRRYDDTGRVCHDCR